MGKEPDLYTATYTVHGASVGHTSLRAVTYLQDGRTVASHAKPIEVRYLHHSPVMVIKLVTTLRVDVSYRHDRSFKVWPKGCEF